MIIRISCVRGYGISNFLTVKMKCISNVATVFTVSVIFSGCNDRPQRSWGKVMFSQACVILFTGGGHAWLLGVVSTRMVARGACVVGGHVWLPGGMHGYWGACVVVGGVHGCWGGVWLLGDAWLPGGHAWLPGGA